MTEIDTLMISLIGTISAILFAYVAIYFIVMLIFPKKRTDDDDHTYGDSTGWPK